jgi:ribosomal peptide maturation radical SAM protein 1
MISGCEDGRDEGLKALRVALVSMPFGALERPSLGLGLLQAGAERAGHQCRSHYFGFGFAECVGLDDYLWVCNELPYTSFAGDWLFTADLHGADAARDVGYLDEILRGTWRLDERDVGRLVRMRQWVEPFLERCAAAVQWTDVDVVGFTSTFQQNIASLALARRLAAQFPHLKVVFGGANWEGDMGVELHCQYPFVDIACSGEADTTFPALLDALASADDQTALTTLPGIVRRLGDGATVANGPSVPIDDLDMLPMPNFDDFVSAFEACSVTADLVPIILMETSRGCWWGAHSHCTFCGLNGGSMAYRSKSPDRAFDELEAFVGKFASQRIGFVDNILDMRYFRTFLPRVAVELPGLNMFYEVKSSLTNRQIETLFAAGVYEIQPGIESLSDHVLDLMRKGTSTLKNVQLLKWCAEHGVTADWNVLYGVPGETADDYESMLSVIAAISHLQPPTACGPIRLDRFSPYHNDPKAFGITAVTPMAPYRWLYPADADALDRIAYYFEFTQPPDNQNDSYTRSVRAAIESWQQNQRDTLTQIVSDDDHIVLLDTREATVQRHDLTGWQAAVYLACDHTTAAADLMPIMTAAGATAVQLAEFVNWCVANRLMLVQRRECLSLAVRTPARRHESEVRPRYGRRLALLGSGTGES